MTLVPLAPPLLPVHVCRVNPDGSKSYLVLLDTEGIDAWDQVRYLQLTHSHRCYKCQPFQL